jgi:hypothetical protein
MFSASAHQPSEGTEKCHHAPVNPTRLYATIGSSPHVRMKYLPATSSVSIFSMNA